MKTKKELAEYSKNYRQKNKNKLRIQKRKYYLDNREKIIKYNTKYIKNNPEINKKASIKHRAKVKLEVFKYYSNGIPKCACCYELVLDFLTIDHISGDGAFDKKIIGSGHKLYNWLKKHRFPPGYQILCWNCNSSKGQKGICFHNR